MAVEQLAVGRIEVDGEDNDGQIAGRGAEGAQDAEIVGEIASACGGNASDGYSRVVSFGDSLSADLVLAALVARGWL